MTTILLLSLLLGLLVLGLDETVTAADVLHSTGIVEEGVLGETGTQGESVYLKSDRKWYLAKKSGTVAESGDGSKVGILLTSGAAGQPCKIHRSGDMDPGFTPVAGKTYVIGDGYGGIAAVDDLASTNYTTVLGVGVDATTLRVNPIISGVQVP